MNLPDDLDKYLKETTINFEKARLLCKRVLNVEEESRFDDCWEKLSEKLAKYPQRKFHHSSNDTLKPYSEEITRKELGPGKPGGLWYSCGNGWLDWCLAESFGFGPYLFEVCVDMDKIKVISNVEEFDEFALEYGVSYNQYLRKYHPEAARDQVELPPINYGHRIVRDYIDWGNFLEKEGFYGIEINPYLWKRRLDGGMWYYGWDCASGVIWNKDAVTSVEMVAYYEEGEIRELAEF